MRRPQADRDWVPMNTKVLAATNCRLGRALPSANGHVRLPVLTGGEIGSAEQRDACGPPPTADPTISHPAAALAPTEHVTGMTRELPADETFSAEYGARDRPDEPGSRKSQ